MVAGTSTSRTPRRTARRGTVAAAVLLAIVGGVLWWSSRAPSVAPTAPQASADVSRVNPGPQPAVAPAESASAERQPIAGRARVVVRVTTESGAPLAGVDVWSYREGLRPTDPVPPAIDTERDGRAVLELEPGKYSVCANAKRERLPERTQEFVEVTVVAGEEIERVVMLCALDANLDVQVLDDRGAPVADVDLRVRTYDRTASTNAVGRASLERLPPRPVRLEVDAAPESVAVPYAFFRDVELRARGAVQETIRLERTGSLRVRVTVPAGGDALDGIRGTFAAHGQDQRYAAAGAERTIALPGEIVVEHLPPGSYGLRLTLPSDLPFAPDGPATTTVRPGEETLVEFALRRGTGVLSGAVTGPRGLLVAGLYVMVLVPNAGGPSVPPDTKSVSTDAEGRYRFLGLPQREVLLYLQVRHYEKEHLRFVGTFQQPSLATMPVEGFDVRIERGFGIRGKVRTASGRAARTGSVKIDREWFAGEAEKYLESDSGGAFEFRHLRPGRYRLWYEDANGERASAVREVEVGVGPDAPEFAEVELTIEQPK